MEQLEEEVLLRDEEMRECVKEDEKELDDFLLFHQNHTSKGFDEEVIEEEDSKT